jgi:hypothetical protein
MWGLRRELARTGFFPRTRSAKSLARGDTVGGSGSAEGNVASLREPRAGSLCVALDGDPRVARARRSQSRDGVLPERRVYLRYIASSASAWRRSRT